MINDLRDELRMVTIAKISEKISSEEGKEASTQFSEKLNPDAIDVLTESAIEQFKEEIKSAKDKETKLDAFKRIAK